MVVVLLLSGEGYAVIGVVETSILIFHILRVKIFQIEKEQKKLDFCASREHPTALHLVLFACVSTELSVESEPHSQNAPFLCIGVAP